MALPLGTTGWGRQLALTDEQRSRHIHIVGASGTGKSKLLESMIRDDIFTGRGLCLIDPHGTLADAIAAWCAALRLGEHRRIHYVDPKDMEWSLGFNPLHVAAPSLLQARVDAMVGTCAEVWGGEDLNQTPLLTTCLQLIFYALAANNLTMLEAVELTATADVGHLRKRLTETLPDYVYRAYWQDFSALSKRDFEERFSSTRRRLLRFLGAPSVRRIIGQQERRLDLTRVMNEGDVLIVNLASRDSLSEENARLLGALLMSEMRLAAMARDSVTARTRPFSLYVDECYHYLTGDVEQMLDQTRKFGLHAVLSHQRLGQLRKRSESIYSGVMGGAQTKIVFGNLQDDDAEVLAKEIYRSTFDLEKPKRVLDKPVVVDEVPYWLDAESWGEGSSTTSSYGGSSSWGTATGGSAGLSERHSPQAIPPLFGEPEPFEYTQNSGDSWGEHTGGGESWSDGSSSSTSKGHGRSQTLKPVRVMMPTALYSLDEQLHLAIVKLRELPNQAAIVKRPGRPPVRFRPPTIKEPLASPAMVESFLHDSRSSSPYIAVGHVAELEISVRTQPVVIEVATQADPFWSE